MTRAPLPFALFALLAAVPAACGGAKSSGGPSIMPSCAGCDRTRMGAPTWEPTDAVLLANRGTGDTLASLLGPKHQFFARENVYGPAVVHAPPYAQELAGLLAMRGLAPRQALLTADFQPHTSLILVVAVAPSAGAPAGSSFDFAQGPIIPNGSFPITARVRLYRDGAPFDDHSIAGRPFVGDGLPLEVPGYDTFFPPIVADGASHFFFAHDETAQATPAPSVTGEPPPTIQAPPDGTYALNITMADMGGEGWVVNLPFTVNGGGNGDGGAGDDGGGPPLCTGAPPARDLITDFSDATTATALGTGVAFGAPPNIVGRVYAYAARGLGAPVVTLVSTPSSSDGGAPSNALAMTVRSGTTADPQNAGGFGFGLAFDSCVDVSAYKGVRFKLDGDPGTCDLRFAVSFSEDQAIERNPVVASCTTPPCRSPSGFTRVGGRPAVQAFDDFGGGSPLAGIDRQRVTGLEWQMNVPPDGNSCTANLTLRDISFVTEIPPPTCTPLTPSFSAVIVGEGSAGRTRFVSYPFTFAAGQLAPPMAIPTQSPVTGDIVAVHIIADPGPATDPAAAEIGAGMELPRGCVDATDYTAIRFTVGGDLGTCTLALAAAPIADVRVSSLPPTRGVCTDAVCRSPRSPPLALGTRVVRFADMQGGAPVDSVDLGYLAALEWVLGAPTDGVTAPCHADLTITDVSFIQD